MTDKNENRRVRMTKRLMKDALLELLEKNKTYTVQRSTIITQIRLICLKR